MNDFLGKKYDAGGKLDVCGDEKLTHFSTRLSPTSKGIVSFEHNNVSE